MKATIVICKGDPMLDGNKTRIELMNIVLRFIARVNPRCELLSDDATIVLNYPNAAEGDYKWCLENVMNKVYLDSVYNDNEAQAKADRLYEIYTAREDGAGKVGLSLIKHYLRTTYMQEERLASVYTR